MISSWIYKTFAAADGDFANWLHNHGYAFNGNRKFKLFSFSNLQLAGAKIIKGKNPVLSVSPGSHQILLTFYMEEAAQYFIQGLFAGRELIIADKNHRAEFNVNTVEHLPAPDFKSTCVFKSISPIVLSKGRMDNNKLRAQYLSPEDDDYGFWLKENLIRKYIAAHQERVATSEITTTGQNHFADLPFKIDNWNFRLLGTPKSKLLTIKEGTPMESKIRGYLYTFELTASPELMSFAYHAGFGEKCSLGMGCVEREEGRRKREEERGKREEGRREKGEGRGERMDN